MMMSFCVLAQQISGDIRASLSAGRSADQALDDLLVATRARAVGIWRHTDKRLLRIGFRAAADMAPDVKEQFAAATESVSLEQTGLGIVKSFVNEAPAIVTLTNDRYTAGTSESWLARFQARQSLAVPIRQVDCIVGVLAISTANELRPESLAWQVIVGVAAMLGQVIDEASCIEGNCESAR